MAESQLGIDFGTTTSFAAATFADRAELVPLGTFEDHLPSVLGIDGSHRLVAAEDSSGLSEDRLIRSAKRAITENLSSFEIPIGADTVEIDADHGITKILEKIRGSIELEGIDLDDRSVRLGCPAMWTGQQRRRLLGLAEAAGLRVGDETLIDEPIAAAVAWVSGEVRSGRSVDGKVLVFDMGGGTLDVAVLQVEAGPYTVPSISVQSSVGSEIAGDRVDEAIADLLEHELRTSGAMRGDIDQRLRGWLLRAAREAKIRLGDADEVQAVVQNRDYGLPAVRLVRSQLDEAVEPLLRLAMDTLDHALRAALMSQVASRSVALSMSPKQARALSFQELVDGVKYVVAVGGMSIMPAVRDRLVQIFGAARVHTGSGFAPTQAIAMGLGEQASYERMNLHRPPFDVTLEWSGEGRAVVYEAYSPLYDMFSALHTDSTQFRWTPDPAELPRRGFGTLRLRSANDQVISFRLDGDEAGGIRFAFGQGTPVVLLSPNGHVYVRDGAGYEQEMRIAQWPVIRGQRHEAVVVERVSENARLSPNLVWHQLPYD